MRTQCSASVLRGGVDAPGAVEYREHVDRGVIEAAEDQVVGITGERQHANSPQRGVVRNVAKAGFRVSPQRHQRLLVGVEEATGGGRVVGGGEGDDRQDVPARYWAPAQRALIRPLGWCRQ